jgi:hypothetical protein
MRQSDTPPAAEPIPIARLPDRPPLAPHAPLYRALTGQPASGFALIALEGRRFVLARHAPFASASERASRAWSSRARICASSRMAIVSPALTLSPSRTRTSRMRPVVLEATAESSPSIRPLTTTMLFGIRGAAKKISRLEAPPQSGPRQQRSSGLGVVGRGLLRLFVGCLLSLFVRCFLFLFPLGRLGAVRCGWIRAVGYVGFAASVAAGLAASAGAGFAPGGSVCLFCSACSGALSSVGVVIAYRPFPCRRHRSMLRSESPGDTKVKSPRCDPQCVPPVRVSSLVPAKSPSTEDRAARKQEPVPPR